VSDAAWSMTHKTDFDDIYILSYILYTFCYKGYVAQYISDNPKTYKSGSIPSYNATEPSKQGIPEARYHRAGQMRTEFPKDDSDAIDNQYGITAKAYRIYEPYEFMYCGKSVLRMIIW